LYFLGFSFSYFFGFCVFVVVEVARVFKHVGPSLLQSSRAAASSWRRGDRRRALFLLAVLRLLFVRLGSPNFGKLGVALRSWKIYIKR
jgi:hypothetical protein